MHGQKITIPELIRFQKNDAEYFESATLKKGFEYTSTDANDDANIISYSFYHLKGTRSAHFLRYYDWKLGLRSVMYQTTERAEYIALKTEAKKLGFKSYKIAKLENDVVECYKKSELCICFNTTINVNNQNPENNIFQIDVRPSALVQK
jgi:hypothetical protein